jgi:hypothetical protein
MIPGYRCNRFSDINQLIDSQPPRYKGALTLSAFAVLRVKTSARALPAL